MRIEQLIQFREYIRCKSLTSAAQKLFMTPQALHVSIKRLEEELDTKLAVKVSGEIKLTDSGQLFWDFAKNVLREYQGFMGALEDQRRIRNNLSGKLYIYSNMLFQRNVLPNVIKRFQTDYPDVRLRLFESDTRRIYEEFTETPPVHGAGRIGFLQVPQPKGALSDCWHHTNGYVFQELYKGFFYACCDPKLSLNSREPIRKLLKYPLLLYATSTTTLETDSSGVMNPTLLLLSEYGDVEITYSVNTMELWRQTLLTQSCVGVIHSSLVEQNDPIIDGLQLITVKEKLCSNLGCLRSQEKNELEEAFIKYVIRYFSSSFH
ncbi:MAG: LysR family transcriptional regulator [Mailhella sp.]|nr:LysR family transcriptional regulator [Mailhella sp.]